MYTAKFKGFLLSYQAVDGEGESISILERLEKLEGGSIVCIVMHVKESIK